MTILGHGIDVVDVPRIANLLDENDDFLSGWFTVRALDRLGQRTSQAPVIAGRVAAKEAVVKALGCGFNAEVSWQDVEILSTDAGGPVVHLSAGAATVARTLGISTVFLSISHTATLATASVIAVGP